MNQRPTTSARNPRLKLNNLLRITPQQLRAFEATARCGSVTRAAAELHVTQPTVSVQLRELAETIGEPLIESVGRGIRITQTGELLVQAIGELTACWQRFESRVGEVHGLVSGRLRIAAVTTAEYFVPDLVGPFAAAHPGVDIELTVENRDRVVERLQRGLDDLAVMMLPPSDLPLEMVPILDNPLVVIAPAKHPAVGKRLRLTSLQDERWLMRENGSGTRRVALEHFSQHGFEPRIAMSLGSNEAIKHAVASGLGIAVLSEMAVRSGLGAIRRAASHGIAVLDVSHFPIRRHWSAVWRWDQPQSVAAQRFVQYLKQDVQSLKK
jgi:LysR family transcriptional regulator, low CO2-responsive transcriptional regulator